ncbi:hypothetical protein E2562_004028 [Oryza meyeriana var. granulata]|uniref:F-box domain-containing protein n=1 Tax=Oryza meyeriana var. granulata TaxID=110450 RepID=A0A6G1BIN9_9ORYZ|nr:hypothetical protein E2562_004028 [Oryza meyeriana var. granulata]
MSQPNADDDGDCLSTLPDCLLHTVMSLLPARQAVQTCALSRRWRDLWRSMPCLDIDDHELRSTTSTTSPPAGSTPRLSWEKLENFTTNLRFAHNAPFLDRFRLHLPNYRHIAGHPVALETTIGVISPRRLPCIRSWCPVMEAMELKNCVLEFNEIACGTLKSLVIDDCRGCSLQLQPKALAVTAPKLTSLCLRLSVFGFTVSLMEQMISIPANLQMFRHFTS